MPPKHKTEKEKKQEREKILNAASKIISHNGYNSLTMRELAKKCKTSTAKIYYYFINKDHVYFELMKEGFNVLVDYISDFNDETDLEKRLIKMFNAFYNFSVTHPFYYDLMFVSNTPRCLDCIEDERLTDIAKSEKMVAMKFYTLIEEAVNDLALKNNKETNEMDTIKYLASLHGIVSLNYSRNLKEINFSVEDVYNHAVKGIIDEINR